MREFLNRIAGVFQKNRHFKYGVPFIGLVVGSSFLISEINTTRYDYRKQVVLSSEEAEKFGIKKREVTVEKVYEDYKKKDLQDDYEIVRGPRPWELEQGAAVEGALQNRKVPRVVKSKESYTGY